MGPDRPMPGSPSCTNCGQPLARSASFSAGQGGSASRVPPTRRPRSCVRPAAGGVRNQGGCDALDVTGVSCTQYHDRLAQPSGAGSGPLTAAPSRVKFSSAGHAAK